MGSRGAAVRSVAARVVWACCATVALLLAVAALLVGLRVDEQSAVGAPARWAEFVDLPYVARGGSFDGVLATGTAQTIGAWSLAAVAWLLLGALLILLVRPRRRKEV